MVVYADAVFALNALLDYLLLSGAARLGGAPVRWRRFLLAAALGGLYAALCAVPQLTALRLVPVRVLALALMLLAAFGANRRTLWQGALFVGLSLALCGVLTALALLLGVPFLLLGGTACYALDFPSMVLAAGAAYALTALCFSGLGGHSGGDLVSVQASLGGRAVRFTALRDTGNTLRDPISGRAVLIADCGVVRALLPPGAAALLTEDALRQPAELLRDLSAACPELRLRLIPYRAVGVQSAMLLAVRCDAVRCGGKTEQGGLLAASPTAVSDGGAYRALVGGV